MGEVTSFIGSVHWWVAAYKYPVASLPFLPSAFCLLPCLSHFAILGLLPSHSARALE